MVCQAAPERATFHHLAMPAALLKRSMNGLATPGDGTMVSLFLSTEAATRFQGQRGTARIGFGQFLRSHRVAG